MVTNGVPLQREKELFSSCNPIDPPAREPWHRRSLISTDEAEYFPHHPQVLSLSMGRSQGVHGGGGFSRGREAFHHPFHPHTQSGGYQHLHGALWNADTRSPENQGLALLVSTVIEEDHHVFSNEGSGGTLCFRLPFSEKRRNYSRR